MEEKYIQYFSMESESETRVRACARKFASLRQRRQLKNKTKIFIQKASQQNTPPLIPIFAPRRKRKKVAPKKEKEPRPDRHNSKLKKRKGGEMLYLPKIQNPITMIKSFSNIADMLRKGANVKIKSDDFRFSEIYSLAQIAINNETTLHVKVGDQINAAELISIASTAKQFVMLDFTD